jgi:hypothetical protein
LIKDFNRRILLTTDVEPATTYKGIQKINVIDWLLEEKKSMEKKLPITASGG